MGKKNSSINEDIIPLILAAGNSARFGKENKLLYKIDGKSIICRTLEAFIGSFKTIIMVVGFEEEKLKQIVEKMDHSDSNIVFVTNDDWYIGGMSSSVVSGIDYIKKNCYSNGVLIHPGDIPFIKNKDVQTIVYSVLNAEYDKIVIPTYNSKNGHPTFIPSRYFPDLLVLNEQSEGLRGFLKKFTSLKRYTVCGPEILKDFDIKNDLQTE